MNIKSVAEKVWAIIRTVWSWLFKKVDESDKAYTETAEERDILSVMGGTREKKKKKKGKILKVPRKPEVEISDKPRPQTVNKAFVVDRSRGLMTISVNPSEVELSDLSYYTKYTPDTFKMTTTNAGTITTFNMGDKVYRLTAAHVAEKNPEVLWSMYNTGIYTHPEIPSTAVVAVKTTVNGALICQNLRSESFIIGVRPIWSAKYSLKSPAPEALLLMLEMRKDMVYSGSPYLLDGIVYLLTTITKVGRNTIIALCRSVVSDDVTIAMQIKTKNKSTAELASKTSERSTSQITYYNLSSAPAGMVETMIRAKYDPKSRRKLTQGALAPPSSMFTTGMFEDSCKGETVIIVDEDDRNRWTKIKTLTGGRPTKASWIEIKVPEEVPSTRGEKIFLVIDQHSPTDISKQRRTENLDNIQHIVSDGIIQYEKPIARWAAGTAGIVRFAIEKRCALQVIDINVIEEDTWIMLGSAVKATRGNIKYDTKSIDAVPRGDPRYSYRAGATNIIRTPKGPIHFKQALKLDINRAREYMWQEKIATFITTLKTSVERVWYKLLSWIRRKINI